MGVCERDRKNKGEFMAVTSVEDLKVFKKAHEFTIQIYKLTNHFPMEERYGLASQLQRAAVSIGANLAEGGARIGRKEFRQFVGIAKGSAAECSYLILVGRDLSYIDEETYDGLASLLEDIQRMLYGLIRSLEDVPT